MAPRTVSDSDGCAGSEGLAKLHTGKNHSPHPATPPPIAHPEPGPREYTGRYKVPTGAVSRAH